MTQTPEARKAYLAAYRAANKDKSKAWREAHKDKLKKYDKEYSLANRLKLSEYQKKWREANKEYKKVADRAWQVANMQLCVERATAWKRANREKYLAAERAYSKRNPERLRAACDRRTSRCFHKLSPNIRAVLFERQQGMCAHCLTELWPKCELDHMKPLSKGGLNVDANVQLLCKPCNRAKGNREVDTH